MGKILIVDDEIEICDILAENLVELGHFVTSATSGKKALEILSQQEVDLIISDVRMHDGDGFFLIEEISKRNIDELPKFIFMTGFIDEELIRKYSGQVKAIHQKPLDFDAFLDDISDCLVREY